MTLDEAIKRAEEVAGEKMEEAYNLYEAKNYEASKDCIWCAEEQRQLAEWLKDYKRLLEKNERAAEWYRLFVEKLESDHKCHTCKHYTNGEYDGSCGSYICKEYSNWESEEYEQGAVNR